MILLDALRHTTFKQMSHWLNFQYLPVKENMKIIFFQLAEGKKIIFLKPQNFKSKVFYYYHVFT